MRTFLIGLTVLCIWLGIKVGSACKQRDAVAAIRNLGSAVEYDYHRMAGEKTNQLEPNLEAPGPKWLCSLMVTEYSQDVILDDLSRYPIADDDLAILKSRLPRSRCCNSAFDERPGGNVRIDNYQIDAIPVPEPATWLLALGFAAAIAPLSGRTKRAQNSAGLLHRTRSEK